MVGQGNKRKQEQIKALKPLDGGNRRQIWGTPQRKQWQRYKTRGAELAQAEVQLAVAASLKPFLAQDEKQKPGEGWTISEEGLERHSAWLPEPTLLVGRYAGRALMDFLSQARREPYSFPGPSLRQDM